MPYFNQIHNDASRKLARLIQDRLQHPERHEQIDAEIWSTFGEDHAIMFTDLSGFSRGVEKFGIMHFLQMIYESEVIFAELVEKHSGHIIKTEADSMLIIFDNPKEAVDCGIEMQQECARRNLTKAPEDKILLCLGIGFGRILNIAFTDVFGSEVNAASKLGEDIARSNEILVTDTVQQLLSSQYSFEPIDEVPSGAKGAFRLNWQ